MKLRGEDQLGGRASDGGENQEPVERFTADGAYDTREMYSTLEATGTPDLTLVIPPKLKAALDSRSQGAWRQRNDALSRIGVVGRRQWRKESGTHHQARAENGMYRYKRIIGESLRARKLDTQVTEAMVTVRVLNQMTNLGRPNSVVIAS